jgi:hypothetical protein
MERLPRDIQGPKTLQCHDVAVELGLRDVQQLNPGNSLEPSTITYVLALMQSRDARLATAHKDVNSGKESYVEYMYSAFMPPKFMELVVARQMVAAKSLFDKHCGKSLDKLFQLYVPWLQPPSATGSSSSKWTAFALRLAPGLVDLQRGGLYFDPMCFGKYMSRIFTYFLSVTVTDPTRPLRARCTRPHPTTAGASSPTTTHCCRADDRGCGQDGPTRLEGPHGVYDVHLAEAKPDGSCLSAQSPFLDARSA